MPAQLASAVNADKFTHFDNAKLDIKNFVRIKTFTNKHSEWKEWKNQFSYAVAECDSSFAKTLTGMEKNEQPIVALTDLNPTQAQLSAILFNRLQAVTTGTANTMVMSTEGNGCEAWRLLNKFFDRRPTKGSLSPSWRSLIIRSEEKTSKLASSIGNNKWAR